MYETYHDQEWGVPVTDDHKLFEFLLLESFQAGLSWLTILKKRENFKAAFAGFQADRVARFTESRIARLMQDEGIVRNQAKIRAAVGNARAFLKVQKEFGSFASYLWSFTNYQSLRNPKGVRKGQIPDTSKESDALSKDLKKRGFKFVGSTICYAHMQATGMINDHTDDCFRAKECQRLGKRLLARLVKR